jgi:hypothetical protein
MTGLDFAARAHTVQYRWRMSSLLARSKAFPQGETLPRLRSILGVHVMRDRSSDSRDLGVGGILMEPYR